MRFNNKENKKRLNNWIDETSKRIEEEDKKKQQDAVDTLKRAFEPKKKNTVFRRFSDNKDYKELFPRPEQKMSTTPTSQQTYQSQSSGEGNMATRGSINGRTSMGPEGSAGSNYTGVNPDLRRRLEEKKKKEREEAKAKRRASIKESQRQAKIEAHKKALKRKSDLRRAVITAEIIGPPKAKKFY